MYYDHARGSSKLSCVYMSSSVKTILPLTFLTYEKPLFFWCLFSQTICFVEVYQQSLFLPLFVAMSKTPELFLHYISGGRFLFLKSGRSFHAQLASREVVVMSSLYRSISRWYHLSSHLTLYLWNHRPIDLSFQRSILRSISQIALRGNMAT